MLLEMEPHLAKHNGAPERAPEPKLGAEPESNKAADKEYTTMRIYAEQGAKLSDLKDAMGLTIADCFKEKFDALLDKFLTEELEKKINVIKLRRKK